MSVLIKLAEQALQQAEQMNSAAKDSDWDKVGEIQAQHSELVSKIAIAEVSPEQVEELRKALLRIRKLNSETETLAADIKEGLVREKKTMNKASKMQKALDAFK